MTIARKLAEALGTSVLATALAIAILIVAGVTSPLWAHDDGQWVMDQQLRNRIGEWCCGKGDCNPEAHTIARRGYSLATGELVPFGEAMPLSIDGRLWVCRRPNGTIRCVFDRPPGS